jgi:SAM-dependent methyltransferase
VEIVGGAAPVGGPGPFLVAVSELLPAGSAGETGPAPSAAIVAAEVERLGAAVTRLLPVSILPFFDARFTRSHVLFDEFVYRLALRVFVEAGLDRAAGDWVRADDLVAMGQLDPRCSLVPVDWLLRHLASRGVLAREDGGPAPRFRAERALPVPDPAPVLAEQQRHDAACLPSYRLAETAAREYPAVLRGERSGDQVLLSPARLPLWTAYFSNENPLYAVNNRVGAAALASWMPPGAGAILELGGGLGSGAAAVLEALRPGAVGSYRFTELVPAFLGRARRLLEARSGGVPLAFAPLDMNRSFAAQGVAPATVSVVYAVNTLHVADDLAFTLDEVHRVLEPGGLLVASECVRPRAGQTLYPEFVFNLMPTFRAPRLHPAYRPNGGFLTPEQWTDALAAAGFVDIRLLPDIVRTRETVPTFSVAALGAWRRR